MKEKLSLGNITFKVLFLLFCTMQMHAEVSPASLTYKVAPEAVSQQQVKIKGKVVDINNEPIIGANVIEKGTTNGTTTDIDGNFSLSIKLSGTLNVSYIGYLTKEITIQNESEIRIVLEEDTKTLEEVVVVGYGTQKKVNLTGAVSVINSAKIENRSITRIEQVLQGQIPGLKVVQTSGQPGNESIAMNIRGESTFTSNPILTIIDGVPGGSINRINPNDIESVSVLKDASSTAIYGARAAGGVILITTKTGKEGKTRVSYNSYVGVQKVTSLPKKVTAYEHATLFREAEKNDNPQTTVFTFTEADLERFSSPTWVDHDRSKVIFNEALQTQHDLSLSGGTETQNFYISVSYLQQDGTVMNTDYKRYNIQYNQNFKLWDKLDLKFKGNYTPTKRTAPASASYTGGPTRGLTNLLAWEAYRWGNHIPIYTTNGDWAAEEGNANIIGMSSKDGGQQKADGHQASYNFNLSYNLLKNLKITGLYGLVWAQTRQSDYATKMKFYDPKNPESVMVDINMNSLLVTNSSSLYQNMQFLMDYSQTIKDHTFTILGGYTQEWSYNDSEQLGRRDFLTDNIYAINAGSSDKALWTTSGTMSDWALASFIGRFTYSYKDKYLAEYAMRYDGSSRFLKERRWGLFPSFSLGWRITEENFLKNNPILSYFKIRGSWGQVGNQNVGNYPFASTLSKSTYYFNNSPQNGVYYGGTPNPFLTWETKSAINLGFDGKILGDLLSFTFDIFKEKTTDILLTVPVPTTYGEAAPTQNAGVVENRGWELELSHRNNINNFHYGISFQISDEKNKVIDLKGTGPWISGNTITEEGYSMNEWYGLKSEGFFQTASEVENHSFQNVKTSPGDIKYQENGGDPKTITPDDRVRLGRSDPRFPYGINIDFRYKDFDFLIFGQGVMSHKVFSNGWTAYNFDRAFSTLFTYQLDRWTPETPDARFPKTRIGGVNAQFSSFWLEDAAYFRLKNIQLGYTIPKNIISKVGINNVRLYISAENLITFTKLLGYDPEIPTGTGARLVENRYPISKVFNFGLNINF